MTKSELISALEAATGPSRSLDDVIDLLALENGWRDERIMCPDTTPRYTASLDAALTLIGDTCWAVSRPRQPDMSGKQFWASSRIGMPGGRGSNPAIATCIAALKARHTLTPENAP